MTIRPVGMSIGVWTAWKAPNDWKKADIPPSPGVYQLAVFRADDRARLIDVHHDPTYPPAVLERLPAIEKSNRGLVYIGKAVCLDDRFWRLVRSWQPVPTTQLHDSRETYNENYRQAQSEFQPHEVRCRFKRLSSFNWRTRMNGDLAKVREALWPDSGQGHEKPSAVASFSAEGVMLREYLRWYRELPLLNKKEADDFGPAPSDAELEAIWRDLEAFDDNLDGSALRVAAFRRWKERGCPSLDDWSDWFAVEHEAWDRILKD